MSVSQLTIKSYPSAVQITASSASDESTTVKGWLTRLVGCWHLEMSRPFSSQGKGYRVCLNCGAHRNFSLKNWETQGDFYYSMPNRRSFSSLSGISALRRVAA